MVLNLTLRESGKEAATKVQGSLEPAHQDTKRAKALWLKAGEQYLGVLLPNRAMRLLLSGCVVHVRIGEKLYELFQLTGKPQEVKAEAA